MDVPGRVILSRLSCYSLKVLLIYCAAILISFALTPSLLSASTGQAHSLSGVDTLSAQPEAESPSQPLSLESRWSSAISNDRVDHLKQLLEERIGSDRSVSSLLQTDAPNGKSALMVACKAGDLAFVKELVKLGSSINEVTHTGGTPFMFAVLGNHVAVAEWLHAQGANINAKGSNGWSAATISAAKGQADMMKWLIKAGADINAEDVYRFSPLMRAVDNRHEETVRVLLGMGNANVDSQDESDNTALHYAVSNGHVSVVALLMEYGADPHIPNRDGITPEALAVDNDDIARLVERNR